MIEVKHVTKSYDKIKKANDDITLTIEKGDLYGFIGHNGAGKTTLLKSISGIINFDEGDILVDGYSIKKDPIKVKNMLAYIPDQPTVYESLTGIEFLNFIADLYQISEEERLNSINTYANLFELTDALNQVISSYSHGMKQKLVIISALIHKPKVMLLDEPFVGLDPKASFHLKEIFDQLRKKGTAIFFSTHVLDVAEKLCNKIAIIKDGKIVANGLTKDVISIESLEKTFMDLSSE
ncbi:MAG: ABC transporter ATP-binding protein [Candidatus Izemoplasmataceae bacterium]